MTTVAEHDPYATLDRVRMATSAIPGGLPLRMPTRVDDAVPGAMPNDAQPQPAQLTAEQAVALIADEAMRWTYVLRSRKRWIGDSRARERNEAEARAALAAIGIGKEELRRLTDSPMTRPTDTHVVVVRVPYEQHDEARHWESRIFPWEYVLAAATRERRLQLAGNGPPQALTVMRELQRQAPPPLPQFVRPRAGGARLSVLFVECLPSELRERWSLASEQDRLRKVFATAAEQFDWTVLSDPTADELAAAIRERRPQLVHFAGLDSHQGVRELRTHFGETARVDIGPLAPREPPTRLSADGKPLPPTPDDNLRLADEVTANPRWMVDGVLLKGDVKGERKRETLERRPEVQRADRREDAPVSGPPADRATGGMSYPRLMRAQELARLLAGTGHQAYLVTFNMWNTAARVAPLVVAEGAALAAVGFQDAFDDALAEFVHATLYAQLLDGGWNLPQAFHRTWIAVRRLPESADATGISLWTGAPVFPGPGDPPRAASDAVDAPQSAAQPLLPGVRCDIRPFAELNYAVLHNAQPLFDKFILECGAPGEDVRVLVDVAVHMGTETARYCRLVVMRHGREALTNDIHVPLTAAMARTVREAISSSLVVKVSVGDEVLYCNTHRLRLLPVDQWRDNRRDGRWLPSFVQPRDPAVARALELAQRYNRVLRDDPTAGFEGYQMVDPGDEGSLRAVDRQVEAVWATLLHDWQLGYVNPPPSYSGTLDSQRLRMPSLVHEHRCGTCIDLALLFAACLELIDIYPVIFLLEGHALPGWWRHASFRDEYAEMPRRNYAEIVHATASENSAANAQVVPWHTGKASWGEVRRWIRERKLVPIETVRLTEHCSFVEAIEAGIGALAESRDFDSMLDIVTARLKQVTPLPMLKEMP